MSYQRTLTVSLSALCIALIMTVGAYAGGYNLAGVGAKALSMSGAFRGVADDYSAMYWNPAGLAGQARSATLDGKILYPVVWLTPKVSSPYPGYEGYRNGVEQTNTAKGYPAPTFGLIYPVSDNFTAGISVFAPSALGAEWKNLFTGPPYGYNNTVPYPEKAWSSDLKVMDFHPTIAYKWSDKLKLGFGLASEYGDMTLESPKLASSGAPFPFQDFYIDATLKGTGWGMGFNLGALYKLRDDLNLGIAYRGATTIAIKGTVTQKMILPKSLGMQVQDPAHASLFNGGELDAKPDASANFPIPMDLGVGLGYKCCGKWTLAGDVTWTNWASVKDITIKMTGTGPTGAPATDSKLILRYKNTVRLSLGADYLWMADHNMHLRCGYYYDPSPIPDGSLNPSITDVANKNNISLGFSCEPTPTTVFEGYYERVMTGKRSVASTDMDGDGVVDNLGGDWKLQVDTFGLSVGYKF